MNVTGFIYSQWINAVGIKRLLWKGIWKLAVILLRDPTCTMQVHGRQLRMPLSHLLPSYLQRHPLYDRLPGRLSSYLRSRYGVMKCIDVGANIGDTVAAFTTHPEDSFLAIEANPHFAGFLRENWGKEPQVTILNCICSSATAVGKFDIKDKSGTGYVEKNENGGVSQTRSLDDILAELTAFADFNLLKIDTDGFDFEVIAGAQKGIAAQLPAVFFECYTQSSPSFVDDCLAAMTNFAKMGYRSSLIYDNLGYLVGKFALDDLTRLKELLFHQLTSSLCYYDILVMNENDTELFYAQEKAFLVGNMSDKSLQRMTSSL